VSSGCCGILARGRLLLVRFSPERGRDRQSDCRNDREEPYTAFRDAFRKSISALYFAEFCISRNDDGETNPL
jgi:hypothetical protein